MNSGRQRVPLPPSRYLMPDPAESPPGSDVVAIGADLAPGTLVNAYRMGLFPMPDHPGRPTSRIGWYSPDPRGILPLDGLRVSRSLRRSLQRFHVTMDERFEDVMRACADPGRQGRWITDEFIAAYTELHRLGWANSVEVLDDDGELVGGLYGVSIDRFFAGESMFHRATDASKVALVHLVERLRATGATLLDVQWLTPHLESLGAIEVDRETYLRLLADALD